jgi:hypothetical protein
VFVAASGDDRVRGIVRTGVMRFFIVSDASRRRLAVR